ncbi:MAG: sulfite exporter TauE/SafE family protein [Kiloniellales bacterium]|nr:sulfite exporter TauE/SafE family protein [Kiloniellales bacterium]
MTPDLALIVAAGAGLAGFVAGLAGFGTGLVALGVWLHVLDPLLAAPLVVICAVVGHFQSLWSLRRRLVWSRLRPFLAGGLPGVPLGTLLLGLLDPEVFRGLVGVFLLVYAGTLLLLRQMPVLNFGGRLADAAVGLGGGVLGGFAGLSGPLPTIWCSLKGWSKDEQRSVFQGFNLSILSLALISQALGGVVTREVLLLGLVCLPATSLGAWLGRCSYDRIDDRQFRRLVLWLLLASGAALTVSNLP